MACCIIGSCIMVGLVSATRWIKQRCLGQPGDAPEQWRLSDHR